MGTLSEDLRSLPLEDQTYLLDTWTSQLAETAQDSLINQKVLADEIEDLHWLVTQSDWMQAHIMHKGHYNYFLRDVQLAWDVADKAAVFRPEMIGRQVRYALLQTSINSLSSNIHPATLLLALQRGLWNEETALTYARQVAHGMTKVTMLTKIGTFLRERHQDTQEVFISALAAMREIDHPADYVEALITLAQYLPPVLLSDALAMTQEIAREDDQARAISALAPHLSSELMEEALEIIREIKDADDRTIALQGLASYLPSQASHLLSRFFQMVQDLHGKGNQASVLIALSSHLPSYALPEVQKIAQAMSDSSYRTAVFLAFNLYEDSEKRLEEARNALFVARDADVIEDRAKGIALLASNLPKELLPEAFAIARTIGNRASITVSYRAQALVALAPRLPEKLHAALIAEVQKWNIFYFNDCSKVLVALIPHLSPPLFSTMLKVAHSIIQKVYASEKMAYMYPEDQVPRVLVALFPRLPHALMPDALLAIEDIEAESARGYALAQIAPYLPEELAPKALEVTRSLKAVYRMAALTAFAEHGFSDLLDEALRSAQQIQENDGSTEILPLLLAAGASAFPAEMRPSVTDEALRIVHEIDDAYYRSEAFIALVAFLPPEQRPPTVFEALKAASDIQEPHEQFAILTKLIGLLPPEQRPEVVDNAIKAVQKDFEGNKQDLTVARITALSGLAPFLSEKQRAEATIAAQKLRNLRVRSLSLAAFAPHFPSDHCSLLLSEALKAARKIKDETRGDRFEALALIVIHLPIHERHDVLVEVLATAKKVDEMYRSKLGPILAQLFADLPSDLLSSAVTLARQIWSPQALTALLPRVPNEERSILLDDALVAIRQMKLGIDRAQMLANLIPHAVPGRQLSILEEALQNIQHLEPPVNWSNFSQVVWSLASIWAQLPQSQAYSLWVKEALWEKKSVLHAYAQYRRSYFLTALGGLFQVIVALGGASALTESMNAVLEICCHWSWSYRRM